MKTSKKLVSLILILFFVFGLVKPLDVNAHILDGNVKKSREVAAEGMVLLENRDKALPVLKGERVVLFGNRHIYNNSMITGFMKGGIGSGDVYGSLVRDIFDGMKEKQDNGYLSLYEAFSDKYRTHLFFNKLIPNEMRISDSDMNKALDWANEDVAASTTAVVTIGRHTGETFDHYAKTGDYYLGRKESKLLDKVCSAGFAKVIVVLNIGTAMDTSWIKAYPEIDVVLLAWLPGTEGGLAIADVLCGDVTPSGKLPTIFAKSYEGYPTHGTYHESKKYVNYYEDIFVGYRYFETFDPAYNKVNYEFGYGLSYTDFLIDAVNVSDDGENINVEARVTNTGDVAGKEVVQVYFSAPQGELGKVGKELC